jgi:hypothetical protein
MYLQFVLENNSMKELGKSAVHEVAGVNRYRHHDDCANVLLRTPTATAQRHQERYQP